MIKEAISRHHRAALMFSGGKDSLACLYLLRPYLDKITVVWVNTGNIFPENEEIVRRFAATVPSFLEVKTDVMGYRAIHGLPSDIVPIQYTNTGHDITGQKELKLVSGYDCCAANMWYPALQAASDIGATLIIRGQRNQETAKSKVRSGDKIGPIEFLFPIESWTQGEVLAYLRQQDFVPPEFFHFTESSMDCINCTAFLSGIADRREYMECHHPVEHAKNQLNLEKIFRVIDSEVSHMKSVA